MGYLTEQQKNELNKLMMDSMWDHMKKAENQNITMSICRDQKLKTVVVYSARMTLDKIVFPKSNQKGRIRKCRVVDTVEDIIEIGMVAQAMGV